MAHARSLLGAMLLAAGWAGSALAGANVDRLDDGTILLKLGAGLRQCGDRDLYARSSDRLLGRDDASPSPAPRCDY